MSNPIENKIVWSSDDSSKAKAIGALTDVAKAQAKLTAAQDKAAKSATEQVKALGKLENADTGSRQRLTDMKAETDAVEQQRIAFNDLYDAKRKAAQEGGADAAGDTASGLAGIRGGASALGLGQIAAPLEIAEGFADITEAGKLLGAQLSAVSASAAQAIPGLSGSAAGLVAVGAAAIPIAAIVGAATVAIYQYSKAAKEQAAEIGRTIDGIRNTNQAIADGLTTDEAVAELERLQRAREAEVATLGTAQAAYADMEAQFQAIGSGSGGAGDVVNFFAKIFDPREQELFENVQESQNIISGLDAEIVSLQRALEGQQLASSDAAASAEDLKQAESELVAERASATAELTQSLQRIASYNDQIAQATADRARQELEQSEIEALQQEFYNQDEQAEAIAHRDALVAISRDGRQKIEAIQADLSKLATERQAKLSEIDSAGQSKIAKLNSDYMQKALSDAKAFARESERIEADGNKARLRLIRSITDRLDQASSDNNVVEFLQAEKEGRQQLSDLAQDSNDAEKQRIEDYNQKQAEAAQQQQQRVQEQLLAIEQEKQASLASFDEKRQALVDSIATEKQAIADRTAAAVEAYQQSEALERQQADRQEQLQALRDKHEQDAFDRNIAAITARRDAELAMYAQIQQKITDIGSQLRTNLQAQNSAQSTASSSSPFAAGSGSSYSERARQERSSFGSRRVQAFAAGGIVDKPTVALMGEVPGMKEAIIPFRDSPGLNAALAGYGIQGSSGRNNNPVTISAPINLNLSVGDIATTGMVQREVEQAFHTVVYDVFLPVIENALNGNT